MAFDSHVNLLIGTVRFAPSPSTTGDTLTLMPGDGSGFRANMPVTIFPDNVDLPTRYNAEIAYVTDVAGDVLKLNRHQEDSLPMQVKVGWRVLAGATAKTFTDIEEALAGKADVSDIPNVAGKADTSYVNAQDAILQASIDTKVQIGGDLGGTVTSPTVTNVQHVYNVKDYGAAGDGATDDTGVIQALIDTVGPLGGVIHFPSGTYLVSAPLVYSKEYETTVQFAPSLLGAPHKTGISQSFGLNSTVKLLASPTFPVGEFLIDYIGPKVTDTCIMAFSISGITLDCNTRASGYRCVNAYESTWEDIIITRSPRTPAPANNIGSPTGAANHLADPSVNAWNNVVRGVQITNAQFDAFVFNEDTGSYLIAENCYTSLAGRYGITVGPYTTVINCISKQSANTSAIVGGGDWKITGHATLIGCHSPQAKPLYGSGIVLSPDLKSRIQIVGGEFFGANATGLTAANASVVRVLASVHMEVNFVGVSFGTASQTSSFVYCQAGGTGNINFSGCTFDEYNSAVKVAKYVLNGTQIVRFSNCSGMTPIGPVTISPVSNAWVNNNPGSVDVYVITPGVFSGTTTITPFEGEVATVPNPIGGVTKYTLTPYSTLSWGVGGTITTNPTFLGVGI